MPVFPPLLLITDPAYSESHTSRTIARIATELPPGAFAVQLRMKSAKPGDVLARAREVRRITEGLGVPLVINGDPVIAAEVAAEGVHLGRGAPSIDEARRTCGPDVFVSVAAHDDEDVRRAVIEGATAVLVSPIYASPGKEKARGSKALRAAKEIGKERLLVYALGGIEAENVARCAAAGADGVAVIRALLGAKDAAEAARALFAPFAKRHAAR